MPAVESALARRLADHRPGRHTGAMVRAIAPGYEETRIDAAFARPDGIFWNSDYF
jgi:hypothetical protein